jgi:hypothetical protein
MVADGKRGFGHLLAGELAHEIEMREIAFDHVRVGVDDGMIELGANISARESLEGHDTSRGCHRAGERSAFLPAELLICSHAASTPFVDTHLSRALTEPPNHPRGFAGLSTTKTAERAAESAGGEGASCFRPFGSIIPIAFRPSP